MLEAFGQREYVSKQPRALDFVLGLKIVLVSQQQQTMLIERLSKMRGELWRDVPASARPGGWFLAEVRSKLHEATRGCMNSCTGMHAM